MPFSQMQTTWAAKLDPVIDAELNNGLILQNQPLKVGGNTINHKLGRKLQGWFIVRQRGVVANIYDTQDNNSSPALTLLLTSSAAVNVDIFVF